MPPAFPRVPAGSNGAPEKSRSRSSASSSAAAGTGPSTRKRNARRRHLLAGVRHLEQAVGYREPAPGRNIDGALAERDFGSAPGHPDIEVGIADWRQPCHRTKRGAAADDFDRQALVGIGGPLGLHRGERAHWSRYRCESTVPLTMCSMTHSRTLGETKLRPQPLERARPTSDYRRCPAQAAVRCRNRSCRTARW